ncbi:unnamed protein product [Microthlaspi erraticum]|uniref:PPIase cyclophilin-type domain-containing protein n=1 Tax=Microthlaspi erraticum TaxID=1685480 RepID=A0A6D2IK69_9BRAS|nr:unnamed protein product [Microthlaspi erraticum]
MREMEREERLCFGKILGGDPTGSGTGKFPRPPLIMSLGQFFFTLDKCDWLDKKHTIFGKVTGDSIFNVLRLGEVDTAMDDRPLDPAPKNIIC